MYNQMPFAFTPMSLNIPNAVNTATTGGKTLGLFSKLNFSSILTNTSKILNLAYFIKKSTLNINFNIEIYFSPIFKLGTAFKLISSLLPFI